MVRPNSPMTLPRLALAALSAFALSACSTTGPAPEPDPVIDEALERALQSPPAPELTEPMLLPDPDPALEPLPEERFDVAVDDAPIPAFLMSLVADSEWNLVVHPDVDGRVTLETRFGVSDRAAAMGGSTMYLDQRDRPTVEDLIDDPVTRAVMKRDNVTPQALRALVARVRPALQERQEAAPAHAGH